MKLAICDDDISILNQLEDFIERTSNTRCNYELFSSAEELCQYEEKLNIKFDFYILDIEMSPLSGLDLAKTIRARNPHALIVFLTSYPQYVYDVFEVITFDFILKPITYEKFYSVFEKASTYLHLAKLTFSFSYRKNTYSIPWESILYIEKSGRKAFIHTDDGEIYQCNITLPQIREQLDSHMFSSIHNSCIVNLSQIVFIEKEQLRLKNGTILYVARSHRQELKSQHLNFLKEQI